VLIGIALLWFFQKLASTLGLIVSSWAIQGITAVGALIIIVIFRNEIRTVLQAKNFKAILWGFKKEGAGTPLQIIVDSIFELAQKRIGALLVFPGKEDLKEVVHSGISWDAILSGEMLGTIFWPGNPVHDGAAIIQGDRVTDVGVLLPLSRRTDLPSHYGTRHRASAGLAETTDALVILVSEGKGQRRCLRAFPHSCGQNEKGIDGSPHESSRHFGKKRGSEKGDNRTRSRRPGLPALYLRRMVQLYKGSGDPCRT
ncbi:MAG: DNA integrity scanning protein DisA nucleotide-binding domain protein, partial [Pseudomonadota bacterium]